MEVTISTSNYTFADVSDWLTRVDYSHERSKVAMWDFAMTLAAGIAQFGRTDPRREELFELASRQIGLTVGTLKTYVSAVRSPVASIAIEKELTFQHARAVLGLPEDVADDILSQAVANGWTAEQTSREAWIKKNIDTVPQRTLNGKHAPPPATEVDDEPPFASSTMYTDEAPICDLWTDERISNMVAQCQRGGYVPVQDVARLLRTMRDEYELRLYRR